MATHGKIDEFDPSHEAWATYVERLEFYFIANGIEDPEKKQALLLTVSGPATYKLIQNLLAPKKPPEKSYDELVALVKSHYTPKPSVIMQRFQFHSRTQKPGETVVSLSGRPDPPSIKTYPAITALLPLITILHF